MGSAFVAAGPFLVGWSCGWVLAAGLPRLTLARVTPSPSPSPSPSSPSPNPSSPGPIGPGPLIGGSEGRRPVAVVVPARNEATTIGALLASVRPQLIAGDELVVVDDDSTDDTAAVASAAGARVVVPAGPLPAGWTGKCRACDHGAQATTAPVLVFVDADVTLAPGALDRLAAAVDDLGGLVSVQPWHRTCRPYEQGSLMFNLAAVMGTGLASPWARRVGGRFAYGPVLATCRADYVASGGHAGASVRGSVVEDIALARRYGGRVTAVVDRSLAEFRMYPGGWRDLASGWRKNIAAGAAVAPWWAVALTAAWLWSVIGAPATGWGWWSLSALQVWWFGRRVGRWHPLAYVAAPVLAVVFLVVLAGSVVDRRRGITRWRGRDVSLR